MLFDERYIHRKNAANYWEWFQEVLKEEERIGSAKTVFSNLCDLPKITLANFNGREGLPDYRVDALFFDSNPTERESALMFIISYSDYDAISERAKNKYLLNRIYQSLVNRIGEYMERLVVVENG